MDGSVMRTAAAAQVGRGRASWCEECGYQLRGLPEGQRCPECGHAPPPAGERVAPHLAWSRSVFVGLALMLTLTANAVCSILIQPFSSELGGTAAALNVPGPKLWAMPLLQRPIGRSAELPGVVGTRTAMLSLLGIWLITASSTLAQVRRDQAWRLATRWGCVILFGLAFGATTGSEGMWPSELEPYRAFLVGGVELPAAILLYQYLRRLARHVPGRERRATFDALAWLVPIAIAVGTAILGFQWWHAQLPNRTATSWPASMLVAGVYGTLAIVCGIAATASVGSLAAAYFELGFPWAGRWVTGGRYVFRCARRALRRTVATGRARALGVVAGLLLLVLTMIMGNDMTSWMTARQGLGGNLPFVNFAGPKMWATLAIGSGTGSGYWWDFMGTRTKFLTINLLAAWLVSMPLRDRGGRWLRRWVRWLPTICVGAGVAILNAFDRTYPDGDLRGHRGSELFAIVTVFMEMPATLILYALLARIARELARPGLAKQFRALSVAIIGLVGASLALFVFSRWFFDVRGTMRVIVLSAMYGAASIGIAAWATSAVLSLAGAVWLSELPAPPTGARTAGEALYLAVNDSRAGAKENHLADEVVPEGFAFNAD